MTVAGAEIVTIRGEADLQPAVRRAAAVLNGGGVILCPTDTIYGLSCAAGNPEAVSRIYAIKGKPETKPSLVLVDSIRMAEEISAGVPATARRLMDAFWPGPLTIILEAAPSVSRLLTAGTGTIGVRLPADDFCRRTSGRCGSALLSTSANRTGIEPSAAIGALRREFAPLVDLIVDAGARISPPSTLADCSKGELTILREGAISGARILRALSSPP